MIAKRIPARLHTSSISRLVRYVVNAKGGIEPRSWEQTADYILDTNAEKNGQGEKVGGVRVTNCVSDNPIDATIEILNTQAKNTRSKKEKTYHLVFSFPPGEQPPLETLNAIEDELCATIGYADHQRISAVHIDTDHLHVHVAINKVHPTGHQNIEPFYDKQRLMEACERLEIKFDLQRTNHGLEEMQHERKNRSRIQLGPEQQPGERDSRFRRYLRESYNLTIADPPEAETLNSLRNLSGIGVARPAERNSLLLPGHARSGVEQSGKERLDGLRRQGNGDRTDVGAGRRLIGDRAATVEAQSGIQTLARYVAQEVAPALRAATSWQGVHHALAEHGLQIKERGAGLVIGDPGIPLWVRASQCGRDFSMKAMTDRLGEYAPAPDTERANTKRQRGYSAKPVQQHPSTAQLYAQYQRETQGRLARRKAGFIQLRAESAKQTATLRQWKATQRALLKASSRGAVRKIMTTTIREQGKAAAAKQRKVMAERRAAMTAATTMPSWNDWLAQQAERGNVDALAVLRSRADKEAQWRGDLLTAERAERAKTVIMESMKPAARRDGVMTYRTADGGMVLDRKTVVQAQKATAGAALVAVSLAAERFAGQALVVEGTDEFKRDVARLAGLHSINVRFKDAGMEAARLEAAAEAALPTAAGKPQAESGAKPRARVPEQSGESAKTSTDAVDSWIESRNSARDKISSIDYHRRWQTADAGSATYQGRRKMQNGSEVLLLKRGDEMLVKEASPAVAAKASKWSIGRRVQLDARGRFIDNSRATEL